MKKVDIIKAWTNPEYRESLTAEELSTLPANPAGLVQLPDAALDGVVGGLEGDEVGDLEPEGDAAFTASLRTLFGSRKDYCCPPPP